MQYQGVLVRGIANSIDQLIIGVPLYLLLTGVLEYTQESSLGIVALILIMYFILLEALYGQTLGKKLFKIKVMMSDGKKCTFMGSILRNFGRILDALLGGYLLGIIIMILTPQKQRIGDLLAKTVVVRE